MPPAAGIHLLQMASSPPFSKIACKFYLQDKNNQIFAMISSLFSQGEYLSPISFIILGDILCRWEKISTPNYILLSPNIQS